MGALRAVPLLALLGAGSANATASAGLGDSVVELERLVRAQQAHLEALEVQAEQVQEKRRRLSLIGEGNGSSIWSRTSSEKRLSMLDHMWLVLSAAVAMFMQAGFAMVQAGSCRSRNVQNILMKSLIDICMSVLGWWIFGWSFAFSGPFTNTYKDNGMIGYEQFAGHNFLTAYPDGRLEPSTDIVKWFSTWPYCLVAATIASNGLAERTNFLGYFIFSFMFTSAIFPLLVAFSWGRGWLMDLNRTGFYDFAGSGIVHLAGGTAALVSAYFARPRYGRFVGQSWRDRVKEVPPAFGQHSQPIVVLGTFILWFGWYGFIFGRILEMHKAETGMLAAQAAMNLTLAASAGGIIAYMLGLALQRSDVSIFCNGILAGLVSVSASAISVECGTAFGIGAGGAVAYVLSSCSLKIAKIDDPMDSFSVHGASGIWGVFAASVFDWGVSFSTFHGWHGFRCQRSTAGSVCDGLSDGLGKYVILANLAEITVIIAWVGGLCIVVSLGLKLLRLLRDIEDGSWDETVHVPKMGYNLEDVMPKTSL